MNNVTKLWDSLLEQYYNEKTSNNSDSWYEKLREKYDHLNIEVPEVKTVLAEETFAYVCPDIEGEMPMVFILRKDKKETDYMNLIYDAICEYYKFSDFYDEITELSCDDLLSLCITKYNIPVVQWYKVENTEMLNVRKMRADVY